MRMLKAARRDRIVMIPPSRPNSLLRIGGAPREILLRKSTRNHELQFGAEAKRSRQLHRLIDTFAEAVAVVPTLPVGPDYRRSGLPPSVPAPPPRSSTPP